MAGHLYMLDGTLPGFEHLPAEWNLNGGEEETVAVVETVEVKDWVNANGYVWDIGTANDSDVE